MEGRRQNVILVDGEMKYLTVERIVTDVLPNGKFITKEVPNNWYYPGTIGIFNNFLIVISIVAVVIYGLSFIS